MIQTDLHLQAPRAGKASPFGRRPKFGATPGLSGWVGVVDPALRLIQRNRFQEMMIEDIFGFALPRTAIDLSRQYLFKDTYNHKRELNMISGRERLMMEVMGFMQCWVGLIGGLGGMLLGRKTNGLSKEFLGYNTMDYWKNKLSNKSLVNAEQGLQILANDLQQAAPHLTSNSIQRLIRPALLGKANPDAIALQLAKAFRQESLDVQLGKEFHALPTILEESRLFFKSLGKNNNGIWRRSGIERLGQLSRLKAWTIPLAVTAGFVYNFLSPSLIHKLTKKIDRLEEYPGEMGLRELKRIDDIVNKGIYKHGEPHTEEKKSTMFPFLSSSLKKGNIVPILVNLVPLPFALGFFETEKLAQHGFKKAWTGAFQKGFSQRFLKLYDFSKIFPYTTGQQISSIYAMLILARMATARDDVEFRERTIDAFLGWSMWMLANPWLKLKFAKLSDATGKTKLLKKLGSDLTIKSRTEIEKLISNPALRKATLTNFVKIRFFALIGTILLLGLVEPYLSIKLTEWQTRRIRSKAHSHNPA